MSNLYRFAVRLNIGEFLLYAWASALALIVDYGCYWFLVASNILSLPQAAVAGYIVGLVLAYFLITRKVFRDGWLRGKRFYEALLFAISGLIGVILTYSTVKLYIAFFGEDVYVAKLLAVSISFSGVYFFRKFFVFKQQ